jgi:glucose/arabinose dehydrogenase
VIAACWLTAAAAPAPASTVPAGFHDEVVIEGLVEPTAISFAPDGRVFVAEKSGEILLYSDLGDDEPEVFADLRTEVYDSGDRGLLGLALDPAFPSRPYVYALYTYDHILGEEGEAPRWGLPDQSGDGCSEPKGADTCLVSGRLTRLTASGNEAVDEVPLVEGWCQQFSSHSIGDLQFDSNGDLYASGGDGANFNAPDFGQYGTPPNPCGDPAGEGGALRAQDLRTPGDPVGLNGALIRVDPDTGEGVAGNPLFGSPEPNARRIVAYGFRNPFRFAIAPDGGDVYVANVGWDSYEEIDRFDPGSGQLYNSGWPCFEGLAPTPGYSSLELDICENLAVGPGGASQPLFLYEHESPVIPEDGCDRDAGAAITGIAFYRGGSYPPAYDEALFFADSIRRCIYVMFPGEDGRPDPLSVTNFLSEADLYAGVDIEVGPGGDLFYVDLFGEEEDGSIHRISYDPSSPIARLTANPRWGEQDPLQVDLDASESTDPQAEPLSFDWDLDDDGTFETHGEATRTELFGGGENHRVTVRVSDEGGASSVARVVVSPGNTPPHAQILAPAEGLEWAVGDEIEFEGTADDEEDGDLPAADLYWKTRLLHCPSACHAHPLRVFPAVDSGSIVAPDHDYPAHIEISLTATDSRGLTDTDSIVVDPRAVGLDIASDPPGVELSAGDLEQAAPFRLDAIQGSNILLSAPRTATLDGTEYTWSRWSDGGDRVHSVTATGPATYTAVYEPTEPASTDLTRGGVETVLGKHPGKRTHRSRASFTFSADRPGASFRCRLDRGPFKPCRSPRSYAHLLPGRHTFKVFALDPLTGSADLSPALFSWRELCPTRPTRCRRPCSSSAGSAGRACR